MSKERNSWRHILKNNLFSMSFLWQYSKPYFFFSILRILTRGIESPISLLLLSRLYTMLDGNGSFAEAFYITLGMLALKVGVGAWNQVYNTYITPIYKEKLHYRMQLEMFEKARRIELAKYDDPAFYNDFILSMQFTDSYFMTAIKNLSDLLGAVLTIASVFHILISVDVTTCLVILISSFLSAYLNRKLKKVRLDEKIALAENERKSKYVERTFKLSEDAKELRMTRFKECIDNKYDEAAEEFGTLTKRFGKKKTLWDGLIFLNLQLVYGIVIAMLLYKLAVTGTITLGEFTVVVNANMTFRDTLKKISDFITKLPTQSKQMDMVRAFISKDAQEEKRKDIPALEYIEFRGVSFGYADGKEVLHDVSLTIRKNEKLAIVGSNGAGKTTFVKLLLGLYQPSSGCILYNGIDIREFDEESYRQRLSAVFQDYRIFAATLAENVLGDEFCADKEELVKNALRFTGFERDVLAWRDGIHTVLTREFDEKGRNLSGGEAQKVAIARAFVQNSALAVLDEPSSAIDPIAEHELNESIMKYSKDKTVVFISHRLSTTVGADRICMFDGGRIIEIGSHRELMAKNGKYATLFKVQAEKYVV
ncbi:MAG: ABC transporter ATP-binding protein [Clostridia bacterium]|nr:ABC transporter ATP-binding protein [Clostridia bacterium]